jgi:predicted TIM-barrel fold metal-dependent hydrolase
METVVNGNAGGMTGFPKRAEGRDEPILDPSMSIIDAHQHLFERPGARYMLDDYLRDAGLGHRIIATTYIESQAMSRTDGPPLLRPLGEIEFANGVGAMSASGTYGSCRVAAAIVGYADLGAGAAIVPLLERAQACAPERFRGVRQIALADSDPRTLRYLTHQPPTDLLRSAGFLRGLHELGRRNLSFDATVFHHQLPELAQAAARSPGTIIVLDHTGLALAREPADSAREEVFQAWRRNMRELARHGNIYCKLGGLGTSYWGFPFYLRQQPSHYEELAAAWRPYLEAAIEAFGPQRCMMASNFPNDGRSCGFVPLWNALKHATSGYSAAERSALFRQTAARAYRMELPEHPDSIAL